MSTKLAPRPANEDQRVKAVIKTGLIDAPDNTAFQVYCELAKDITGFEYASFSLFDADMQCSIAKVGGDDEKPGSKGLRHENNICSYVLLDTEPLLMKDMSKDPIWKNHPEFLKGTAEWYGYAGFPVTNKDNFALGTLCLMNRTPKALNAKRVIPLDVAGAFHSHVVTPAKKDVEEVLENIEFKPGKFNVYMNVDAQLVELSNVRERLTNQIDNSVLFHKQITTIEKEENPEYWYHIGPGNVTAGMVKKSISSKSVKVVNSLDSLNDI